MQYQTNARHASIEPCDTVTLRPVRAEDIAEFFEHQLDLMANEVAVFTAADPADRDTFTDKWNATLMDSERVVRTVLADGLVAGYVAHFQQLGQPAISYWLGRRFWGRGVATRAVEQFLAIIPTRPLTARVAADNQRSRRVLEKCGFVTYGSDRSHSNLRRADVDEVLLRLV